MFFTIWKISFNNILNVDEGSQSENSYHIIFSLFEVVYKMPPLHIQTLDAIHSEMNPKKQAVALPQQLKGPKTFKQHCEGDV